MSKPRTPARRTDRRDAMKPLPGRDLVTMTLRQNTVHIVSDGSCVSYVNFFTGTGFVLPVDEFEHAVRLAQVERRRREEQS